VNRRDFLRSSLIVPIAGLPGAALAVGERRRPGRVFVPGYEPGLAWANGLPLLQHPVLARALLGKSPVTGPARLLTRVSPTGDLLQAVFPVQGHDVKISPDGRVGVYCGFEAGDHVAFDPETLDLLAIAPSLDIGWRGGGHAAFAADGHVLLSERAPRAALNGDAPAVRYGRVSIRDPRTLAIVDSYSSFGIDPHDLCFLEGGRELAVANYGSLPRDGQSGLGVPRHVVEACIAVIDVASGRLLEKFGGASAHAELRHLAAGGNRVSAIQALLGDEAALMSALADEAVAYPKDITAEEGVHYLPVPPLLFARSEPPVVVGRDAERKMRHGLSIVFDPAHRQFIATFPSSHAVFAFDAGDGRVVGGGDTRRHGLNHPSGIALLEDGRHYVVTGYMEGLHVYELGSHRLVPEAVSYPVFFGHSHIAVG